MTRLNAKHKLAHARCGRCDSDLITRNLSGVKKAYVFCTNGRCKHAKKPHVTGYELNRGLADA